MNQNPRPCVFVCRWLLPFLIIMFLCQEIIYNICIKSTLSQSQLWRKKKKIFFSHSFKGHNQKKIITTLFQHLAAFQPSPHPQIGQSSSKESAPPNFLHPETQRSKSAATATVISGFHPQPDERTEANAWFCPPSVANKAPIPGKGNWNQGSLGHTIVLCTLWESITRSPQGGLDLHQQNKNPELHKRAHFAF